MVIMSFLDVYGSGTYNLDLSGHSLAGMGDAIKRCRFLGVPVSISIGGFGGAYSPVSYTHLDVYKRQTSTYLATRSPAWATPSSGAGSWASPSPSPSVASAAPTPSPPTNRRSPSSTTYFGGSLNDTRRPFGDA
ncbi:hypothetical protein BAE44_0014469 [Dichanthelium oligosanthes]|uniref:GH18 domain-containing protein n=1 Tax=Dichanthelium oligosanthes TaxID=888268 RepID=A0A1E5VHC1_9POAL|nr:hypothetical protein BAE44_0014469 [Dichanthelium oligosanthes]